MAQISNFLTTLRPTLLAAALLASACALLPLQPDRDVRAPALDGYGTSTLIVTTLSPAAQALFAQGMAQAYAFNEVEAVRAFKAALAQDPGCAMCAWGVAYQLGPNINNPDRGDLREALRYVDYALKHASTATLRERGLIEALALRYAHGSEAKNTAPLLAAVCKSSGSSKGGKEEKADPLDMAYADRMRAMADAHPGDPDIVSIYAEAELIATRGDWWDDVTGKPKGRIGEVADRLEAALRTQVNHTGLNHYLIHTVDALPTAHRAEAAADRLGALAPKSPHLVHMPSHTYAWLGRYGDATRVNQQAIQLDLDFAAAMKAQGFDVSKDWRGHNGRFQWYGALMEGRGDLALQMARTAATRAAEENNEWGEFMRSQPLLTLLRLERWDAVLAEPVPESGKGGKGMAAVLAEQARGVALARTGRVAEAAQALARLEPAAAPLLQASTGKSFDNKFVRGVVEVARARLRAEVALAQQRYDEAIAQQTLAITAAKDVDSSEPPLLAAGTRLVLGDMQLQAKAWAAAEQTFRADLKEHPHSGWALRGLAQALQGQGQGRALEAATHRADLDQRWALADARLRGPSP